MNIADYIDSGIIEEYCLGLLEPEAAAAVEDLSRQHPDIDLEIRKTLETLARYSTVAVPRPHVKKELFQLIDQLEEEETIDLQHPPMIHRHSDASAWNKAVAHLIPNVDEGDTRYYFLQDRPDFQLCVAWLDNQLVEDGHDPEEFEESFLILEGTCECNIGGEIFHLQAGDYLPIPRFTQHTIRNTSTHPQTFVKAMVQRRKAA